MSKNWKLGDPINMENVPEREDTNAALLQALIDSTPKDGAGNIHPDYEADFAAEKARLEGTAQKQARTPGPWTLDPIADAQGFHTIRLHNGTSYGNIDEQPIATVYTLEDAVIVACAPDTARERDELRAKLETEKGYCRSTCDQRDVAIKEALANGDKCRALLRALVEQQEGLNAITDNVGYWSVQAVKDHAQQLGQLIHEAIAGAQ